MSPFRDAKCLRTREGRRVHSTGETAAGENTLKGLMESFMLRKCYLNFFLKKEVPKAEPGIKDSEAKAWRELHCPSGSQTFRWQSLLGP